MTRLNVTLPDDLADRARDELPGLNFSEILREGLWARLRCEHAELYCATCRAPVARAAVAAGQLRLFWADAYDALEQSVIRNRSAEGTARAVGDVARAHGVPGAGAMPRRTRSEREEPWTEAVA